MVEKDDNETSWDFDDEEMAPLALGRGRDRRRALRPGLGPVRPARYVEGPGRTPAGAARYRERPVGTGAPTADRLAARPGALDGAANYWLGVCEALRGRTDAALRAFARVPERYVFDPLGAYLEAKANKSRGRLHDAERRLEQALAQGGPGRDQVRELLSLIYEIEVRFDDVKSLHHASLAEAQDPTRDLKELSNLDLDRLPYEGLKGALEGTANWPQRTIESGSARLGWPSRMAAGSRRASG